MIKKFFIEEPLIKWNKFLCPVCEEPTGCKSQCEKLRPSDFEIHKKKINKNFGYINLYSVNCLFKQDSIWNVDINYPTSSPLLTRLSNIQGVNRIVVLKPYCFQIYISNLFNEVEVKKNINITYKTFIKEMQSLENAKIPTLEKTMLISGVKFPNGKEIIINNKDKKDIIKQSFIFEKICNNFPFIKSIVKKDLENKQD